ncbi:MAG: hypothetical protein V1892_03785 [bacterium]
MNPSIATNGSIVRVVWQNISQTTNQYKYWNLIDDSSGITNWTTDRNITMNNLSNSFQYDPEISCFRGSQYCQLVWGVFSSNTNPSFWQIQHAESSYAGSTWINYKIISNSGTHAWQPNLTQLNDSQSIVIWEQHNGTSADIYGVKKDGSAWGQVSALTEIDEFDSVMVDITSFSGKAYIAWQELIDNNWQVKVKKIEL